MPETYLKNALSGDEQAIMSPADRMRTTENWRQALYNKPAVGLVLLRDHITSPERFDPVFREYIRRWAFKHPTPADFFRTMEDGLGEDLSWFWRSLVLHHRSAGPGGGLGGAVGFGGRGLAGVPAERRAGCRCRSSWR